MATCKHCGVEIGWNKTPDGKYKPANLDGTPHSCLKNKGANESAAPVNTTNTTNSDGSKPCRYCSGNIKWRNLEGRWIPHNLDGSKHMCNRGK